MIVSMTPRTVSRTASSIASNQSSKSMVPAATAAVFVVFNDGDIPTLERRAREEIERIQTNHEAEYAKVIDEVRPLPGANELLARLHSVGAPFAIATSGRAAKAMSGIRKLNVPQGVPIITRDDVKRAKPDPDLFLAAAERLHLATENCLVVGDSVWDILASRRARALGIGLLSGGYGREELDQAGSFRVYDDPADLLDHLDEVGILDK